MLYCISFSGSRRQPADTLPGLGPAPVRLTRSGAAPEAHCRSFHAGTPAYFLIKDLRELVDNGVYSAGSFT